MNTSISAHIIHRVSEHSATASRFALREGNQTDIETLLPKCAFDGLTPHPGLKGLSQLIIGKLRLEKDVICENSIINAFKARAATADSFEAFLESLPTKSYTSARLRRELIGYMLNVGDAEKNQNPEYTVLLSANQKGLAYLSSSKKTRTIPLLTKLADGKVLSEAGKKQLYTAMLADSLYALAANGNISPAPFKTPYIEKNKVI